MKRKNFLIPPQQGAAFVLEKGQLLTVTDSCGEQVSDLFCFDKFDSDHVLSSGRSIDYNDSIYLTSGSVLYSNRSEPMLTIIADTCGRHDFLMTPCSLKMFQIVAGNDDYHSSCHENLATHFAEFNFPGDKIATTFNIFMNVSVASDGELTILPPLSKPFDTITLKAERSLVVGLTACSHEESNKHSLKPIHFSIIVP